MRELVDVNLLAIDKVLRGLGHSYIRPVSPMKRILGKTIVQGLVDKAGKSRSYGVMNVHEKIVKSFKES